MTGRVLLTQARFAAHRGVGRSAVTNWKNQNLIVFAEGEDGKLYVDVARTDARLNAKLDPMRGRPAGGAATPTTAPAAEEPAEAPALPLTGAGGDLNSERREYLREQRFGQALKNADKARELVPVVEMERRAEELGRAARERVHSMFRGMAERLASMRDAREILVFGEEEIDRVFGELADEAEAGAFAVSGDEADADDDALEAEIEAAIEEADSEQAD